MTKAERSALATYPRALYSEQIREAYVVGFNRARETKKIAWEDVGIISNLLRKYEPQYKDAIDLYAKVATEYNRAISKISKDAEAGA